MATNAEIEYLGRGATSQLVAEVKALLSDKQDKGDYALKSDVTAEIEAYVNEAILGGAW